MSTINLTSVLSRHISYAALGHSHGYSTSEIFPLQDRHEPIQAFDGAVNRPAAYHVLSCYELAFRGRRSV